MDRPVVALVLAGGVGTRLYPASRSDRPKQFLPLLGERSLLERTVDRTGFADETVVLTRERFADRAREHAPGTDVLVEPAGKDTGPAMVYAAAELRERFADPVVVALPSDHYVEGAFEPVARTAAAVAARREEIAAVGVEPTRPETGYGYVEPGADRGDHYAVERFHEKPDAETAERYREAGYLWNAGIFAWLPATVLAAARASPLADLVAACEAGDPERGFAAVEPASFDRAIMERVAEAAVVPADFEWDDLGSWDALARVLAADDDGNVTAGDGEALAVDAAENVLVSDDKHVSVVGVEGLAVVAWDDRVLVVPTGIAQRVRAVVERLRSSDRF